MPFDVLSALAFFLISFGRCFIGQVEQQRTSNAAAKQQQRSSKAAATQQQSSSKAAATQQQSSSKAAAKQQQSSSKATAKQQKQQSSWKTEGKHYESNNNAVAKQQQSSNAKQQQRSSRTPFFLKAAVAWAWSVRSSLVRRSGLPRRGWQTVNVPPGWVRGHPRPSSKVRTLAKGGKGKCQSVLVHVKTAGSEQSPSASATSHHCSQPEANSRRGPCERAHTWRSWKPPSAR